MMEISITEIVLFAWAVIATGYALRNADEVMQLKTILRTLAFDADMRDRFVKHFSNLEKSQ